MKKIMYLICVFAAGCSIMPITQSQIDTYWAKGRYVPHRISEIEGTYQQDALGYMGETLNLLTDSLFYYHIWHSDAKIGNCQLAGRYTLSLDTIKLEYAFYSCDSITVHNSQKAGISLDNWLHEMNSNSNIFVIRKVDSTLFLVPPAAKFHFSKSAIERKYLYYNLDSVTVGRSYLARVK